MTIQDLGAIAEIIGAMAVVASLVYLAIQIRQNTEQIARNVEASRLSAFENNAGSANRTREMLILNSDILDLMTREPDPQGRDKILLIGGGIANFTDVAKTFQGIIRALQEMQAKSRPVERAGVAVAVGG